jgi:hypothetical protein
VGHKQVAGGHRPVVGTLVVVGVVAGEVVDKEVVVPVLHNNLDFGSNFPAQNHHLTNYLMVYKYFQMIMNKNIREILL